MEHDDDDDEYNSKLDLQLKPVFYSNFSRLAPFSYMNPFANALSGLTHVSPSLPLGVREKLLSATFKAGSFQAMCFAKALLAGKDRLADKVIAAKKNEKFEVAKVWRALQAKECKAAWEGHLIDILESIFMSMLMRDTGYAQLVQSTAPRYLAYCSKDLDMGIGCCSVNEATQEDVEWFGDNMGGHALMSVRHMVASGKDVSDWTK